MTARQKRQAIGPRRLRKQLRHELRWNKAKGPSVRKVVK